MNVPFDLAGSQAEFSWSGITGSASLTVGGETVALQSGLSPKSWFSLSTTRLWRREHQGHVIEVTKTRPLLFAGFRANAVEIRVDGLIVATAKGR